ncbi:MAG TPA: hypothetical protein VGC13_02115 [Longimicrobium sp.]|jgi:hypothetical protein|uniref:hypothetical protein n=1 Tax=Longimicrobium sp. TaxID=2029185 RepID=UPI002ED809BD
MMDERRYQEAEVAEIFKAATSPRAAQERAPATAGGFSLAELQSIGGEVGIEPERIAEAAAALEVRGVAAPRRTHLGLPVSVARTVDLPRAPTDREWDMLVAELRETFGARGKDRSSGGLRAWNNGNLHAYVEPSETGYRLRLGTTKGGAAQGIQMGVAGLLAGLILAVLLFAEVLDEDLSVLLIPALVGVVILVMNAIRLPGWAREREAQMEHIATRARILIPAAPQPLPSGDNN